MNNRTRGALRPLKYVSTLLLALASSSALALGLGDIRVLSKPGQPLLAEIPVISADPAELENLRVALASPGTFARVGLDAPAGLVSELQFELTRNAQGRAVVRVSTQTPVTTPSLNFLIEADWGQGRLVREYSALVDAPNSALAVAEPEIVAPAGAMSNAIVREPAPATGPAPAPKAEDRPARTAAQPPRTAPSRSAAPAPASAAGGVTVQRGQTLSQIAAAVAREQGINRNQAMVALLRANPDAFIRGNVNLLKQGAVLRSPTDTTTPIDASEAAAIVREHAAQWRQSRAAIPQPASSGVAASPGPAATPAAAEAAAASGARLEIAPAVAATDNNAGTTTGTAAGSEGDMLGNEQLRQAKEDVATRDAEIQELRSRVADLEKLQKQQQSLIAMKDSDLAAAQQRLGQAPATREAGGGGWYWLGLVVLLLVVGGWAVARRRKPSPLPPLRRDGLDATALAAAVPAADYIDELAAQQDDALDARLDEARDQANEVLDEPAEHYADGLRREPVFTLEPRPGHTGAGSDAVQPEGDETAPDGEQVPPATAAVDADADVDTIDVYTPPAHALEAAAQPSFRGVFEFPADGDAVAVSAEQAADADADADASAEAGIEAPFEATDNSGHVLATPGRDRLELAIAYLDLGDAETARTLLQEVAVAADPHSQAQARELLARLG
ncbi:FimV/HubP family polar landmark protein [Stenotrophomonas rhizophila]|uniref:FimV/HubP family polar landmark protein n=1 Tax=Stenotrophomonas rhizophila TaxID=216778 RepID=UPI002A6A84BA|nr:FimV/HubP family polar landmark protein [Stenotrophomonas rhizophila]MDY0954266.1 FimV/HubP family polar landmark protein [Stenotrophomonas rhizophila]